MVLPFTVLRRLECALAPTKDAVLAKAKTLHGKPSRAVDSVLRSTAGHSFYNVSPLDLATLLGDPGTIGRQLPTYVAGFSPGAADVLERYGFADKVARLDRAGLLYQVTARFAELDLSERAVPNDTMGYIFEELLRRFSEMSNETAGEHFTPREVVRLMVNVVFAADDEALAGQRPVRTLLDPACGTGVRGSDTCQDGRRHHRRTAVSAIDELEADLGLLEERPRAAQPSLGVRPIDRSGLVGSGHQGRSVRQMSNAGGVPNLSPACLRMASTRGALRA